MRVVSWSADFTPMSCASTSTPKPTAPPRAVSAFMALPSSSTLVGIVIVSIGVIVSIVMALPSSSTLVVSRVIVSRAVIVSIVMALPSSSSSSTCASTSCRPLDDVIWAHAAEIASSCRLTARAWGSSCTVVRKEARRASHRGTARSRHWNSSAGARSEGPALWAASTWLGLESGFRGVGGEYLLLLRCGQAGEQRSDVLGPQQRSVQGQAGGLHGGGLARSLEARHGDEHVLRALGAEQRRLRALLLLLWVGRRLPLARLRATRAARAARAARAHQAAAGAGAAGGVEGFGGEEGEEGGPVQLQLLPQHRGARPGRWRSDLRAQIHLELTPV
eukprot:scaffold126838_cov51-Phaeocystis_antarctica.AAC.2